MEYKDKETGEVIDYKTLQNKFIELIGNSDEFNEYIGNIQLFIKDYYIEV
jgi:hypothetical protein